MKKMPVFIFWWFPIEYTINRASHLTPWKSRKSLHRVNCIDVLASEREASLLSKASTHAECHRETADLISLIIIVIAFSYSVTGQNARHNTTIIYHHLTLVAVEGWPISLARLRMGSAMFPGAGHPAGHWELSWEACHDATTPSSIVQLATLSPGPQDDHRRRYQLRLSCFPGVNAIISARLCDPSEWGVVFAQQQLVFSPGRGPRGGTLNGLYNGQILQVPDVSRWRGWGSTRHPPQPRRRLRIPPTSWSVLPVHPEGNIRIEWHLVEHQLLRQSAFPPRGLSPAAPWRPRCNQLKKAFHVTPNYPDSSHWPTSSDPRAPSSFCQSFPLLFAFRGAHLAPSPRWNLLVRLPRETRYTNRVRLPIRQIYTSP